MRATLAAALAGAGAIHMAMVPGHMSEWAPEGVAFIVTAWVQLGLALALVLRPRRSLVVAALVTSAAFVVAWAITRTVGPPFGPGSGVAEPASFVDGVCVVLEAVVVVAAAVALWRPRLAEGWSPRATYLAAAVPVAALLLGSVAVASPSAAEHNHGGAAAEGHDHGAVSTDGHDHASEDAASHDHSASDPGHAEPDPLGFSLLSNGHHHAIAWHDLSPATQTELDRQLDITREVAAQYSTVAAATAAGYRRAGPYSPGLGLHYTKSGLEELNPSGVMTDEALRHPLSLMFTSNAPDAELVGFMYYSVSEVEPTGFVGTNDVWHTHSNVCIKLGPDGVDSPFGADLEASGDQCAAVGGVLLPTTQWMLHVWTVSGWESADGNPFSELNPKLACSDGTYLRLPPEEWADNLLNVCHSKVAGSPKT